jgi:hypothetical protein
MGTLRDEYINLLRQHDVALPLRDIPRLPPQEDEWSLAGVQEHIRQLEAQQVYVSYKNVGTEPVVNFIHRLVTVRQRKGPYLGPLTANLQAILDGIAALTMRMLAQAGRSFLTPVYVGLYPTGDLNAEFRPTNAGALVLVNMGSMNLIYELAKVNVLSRPPDVVTKMLGAAVSAPSTMVPLIDDRQTDWLLAEIFNAYIFGRGAFMIQPTPALPSDRTRQIDTLVTVCETFLVAHEFGHILAGHRAAPRYVLQPDAPTDLKEVPIGSPVEEFEADEIAVDLLVRFATAPDGTRSLALESDLFGGILFFFLIDEAIRSLAAGQEKASHVPVVTTHPQSHDRISRIREKLTAVQHHPATFTSRVSSFTRWESLKGWLEEHLPGVREWFDQIDEVMIRPPLED